MDEQWQDDDAPREQEAEADADREAFLEALIADLEGRADDDDLEDWLPENKEDWFSFGRAVLATSDPRLAAVALGKYVTSGEDQPTVAARCLEVGIEMERASEWELAARFYGRGLELEPMNSEVAYFLHNNFAYALNQLGHHETAERHCRIAVRLDPLRHYAWKNLGVALEGRGMHGDAATHYITAVRTCPSDVRALGHLQSLVEVHRAAVELRIPDIDTIITRFRADLGLSWPPGD